MCYVVYFSTDSPTDFSQPPGAVYLPIRVEEDDEQPCIALLAHPHRWYLMSKFGGCSCHYRHTMGGNPEIFGAPEEWFPEDAEDIESTAAFYDLMEQIVGAGSALDIVDAWNGTRRDEIRSIPVSLGAVRREAFRFAENVRFEVRA